MFYKTHGKPPRSPKPRLKSKRPLAPARSTTERQRIADEHLEGIRARERLRKICLNRSGQAKPATRSERLSDSDCPFYPITAGPHIGREQPGSGRRVIFRRSSATRQSERESLSWLRRFRLLRSITAF